MLFMSFMVKKFWFYWSRWAEALPGYMVGFAGRVLDHPADRDPAGNGQMKNSKLEIRNKSKRNFPKTGGIDAR